VVGLMKQLKQAQPTRLACMYIHGRSRQQRYSRLADWDYIAEAARAPAVLAAPLRADQVVATLPVIGNGDLMSWTEYEAKKDAANGALCGCAMLARGALIKPWLPTEIKERRHWDISSGERLDIYKDFVKFGLEHWGSDTMGINSTRRFLLEWLSFTYRYIPVGLLEEPPQGINLRPPAYVGRNDLETLFASDNAADWVKISEMLLGPVGPDFRFEPKHQANAYKKPGEAGGGGGGGGGKVAEWG